MDLDKGHDVTLHVHDLPQLWQKPPASSLLEALDLLMISPHTFNTSLQNAPAAANKVTAVHETGVPAYLTSIIASQLPWLPNDAVREQIWDAASLRLSERSGRTAMHAMTRQFQITDDLAVALHEPSLTGDNLGLKTWASSLLLAKQLPELRRYIPDGAARVLELGAGTGLVGISAACLWSMDVVLTDLEEIVPNLMHNLRLNEELVVGHGGNVDARALDWSDELDNPPTPDERFDVIVAADPIYSPDHPTILVNAVRRWLTYAPNSRVIIELPLRAHYVDERAELKALLWSSGLECVLVGTEVGEDDWVDEEGNPAQVECEWSIWQPR